MINTSPAARKYLRAVRGQLDAPKEDRERLLARLAQAVSAYVEENPEAGAEELAAAFGSPNRCAAELLAECDPRLVARVRRRRRQGLAAIIAVLVLLVALMTVRFLTIKEALSGYIEIYITEDEPFTMNEDHTTVQR
ncbi:MAG: hypothetical protein HDT15_09615 [Oscillibacter sp.]|nr:hypothetical protein [Oscillibacter sp.]